MTVREDSLGSRAGTSRTEAEEWKYAEKAMAWSGWGSPVGAGIFLVALAAAALLARFAILGV